VIGYTFRNSLFDPRIQVGGHQPLQYDVFSSLYSRYFVYAVDYTVTFSNPDTDGMRVGLRVRMNTNTVATAGQSMDYLIEMGDSELRPLNNTGSQVVSYRGHLDVPRLMGTTMTNFRTFTFSEDVSGNLPTYQLYIEPFAIGTLSGQTSTCRCEVKLIYHFIAEQRISAPQS